jgi:hypothetical protein
VFIYCTYIYINLQYTRQYIHKYLFCCLSTSIGRGIEYGVCVEEGRWRCRDWVYGFLLLWGEMWGKKHDLLGQVEE